MNKHKAPHPAKGHPVWMKGLLELAILSECQRLPSSGKDLSETITRLTSKQWKPSPGSIYPMLQKLSTAGLLKAELDRQPTGRRQILYTLTPYGQAILEDSKETLEEEYRKAQSTIEMLFMRIVYGLEMGEIVELKRFNDDLFSFRKDFAKLPAASRRSISQSIFHKVRNEFARAKR